MIFLLGESILHIFWPWLLPVGRSGTVGLCTCEKIIMPQLMIVHLPCCVPPFQGCWLWRCLHWREGSLKRYSSHGSRTLNFPKSINKNFVEVFRQTSNDLSKKSFHHLRNLSYMLKWSSRARRTWHWNWRLSVQFSFWIFEIIVNYSMNCKNNPKFLQRVLSDHYL